MRAELSATAARSLSHFLTYLRVERGRSANTVAAYRRDLERYLSSIAHHDVTDPAGATTANVRGALEAARSGADGGPPLAASSAGRYLAAIRGLHAFLAREGGAPDPAADVHPPKRPARLPKPIGIDEVERLIEASSRPGTGSRAEETALRDRALVEVLYGTGARVSEAIGLDVDDAGEHRVRLLGKGDKERIVPLGSYARAAIDAYLVRARPTLAAAGRGTPALFVGVRGNRLTRQIAFRIVQEAGEAAGLGPHITPHTLRHSYATHLLQGGADVRVVQELLGHAAVTTTQLYTAVTIDSLREVYASAHPRARSRMDRTEAE